MELSVYYWFWKKLHENFEWFWMKIKRVLIWYIIKKMRWWFVYFDRRSRQPRKPNLDTSSILKSPYASPLRRGTNSWSPGQDCLGNLCVFQAWRPWQRLKAKLSKIQEDSSSLCLGAAPSRYIGQIVNLWDYMLLAWINFVIEKGLNFTSWISQALYLHTHILLPLKWAQAVNELLLIRPPLAPNSHEKNK